MTTGDACSLYVLHFRDMLNSLIQTNVKEDVSQGWV